MPELSVIIQWMNQYPKTGWLLLCIYIALGVVRHRVINAESGSVFRGLLNLRKRRLEQMLTQPYLNKNAVRLAKRELRQRSLYRLTGLYNYRQLRHSYFSFLCNPDKTSKDSVNFSG